MSSLDINSYVTCHIISTVRTVLKCKSLVHVLQAAGDEPSTTVRLMKLSLTLVAGGAAAYYVHVHHPTLFPSLLSKLPLQTV